MVELVLFDADHVFVGGVGDFGVRHDAALDNGGVAGVFHAAEVGVLHGDFAIDVVGVLVTEDEVCGEVCYLAADGSECGLGVFGGVCDEFVAGFAEPVEFKPDVGGFVAFGAGEEAGPEDAVGKDVESCRGVCGVGSFGCEEFEVDGLTVGVFEGAGEGVPGADAEEEEVRRHGMVILVGDDVAGFVVGGAGASMIYLNNGGTFIMDGGIITANHADNYGGGVYNLGNAAISGGIITNNSAATEGSEVCYLFGTFNLSGDAQIGPYTTILFGGTENCITAPSAFTGNVANITPFRPHKTISKIEDLYINETDIHPPIPLDLATFTETKIVQLPQDATAAYLTTTSGSPLPFPASLSPIRMTPPTKHS